MWTTIVSRAWIAATTRVAISGGGVAVVGAHGAAQVLGAAGAGLMAHQLINHPGRDAGVLQPGREGVPEVMGRPRLLQNLDLASYAVSGEVVSSPPR